MCGAQPGISSGECVALHHHSVSRPALGCQGVPMPPSPWHTWTMQRQNRPSRPSKTVSSHPAPHPNPAKTVPGVHRLCPRLANTGHASYFAVLDSPVPNSTSKYVTFFAKCVVFGCVFAQAGDHLASLQVDGPVLGPLSHVCKNAPKELHTSRNLLHFSKYLWRDLIVYAILSQCIS